MEFVVKTVLYYTIVTILIHFSIAQNNDTNLPAFLEQLLDGDNNVTNSNSTLPDTLNGTCNLVTDNNMTLTYSCAIGNSNSGLWNFDEIRSWVSDSNYKFKFNIKCTNYAEIVLPWPVKAQNIIHMQAEACKLTGFFGDKGNPLIETTPDQLDVLHLENCIVLIGLSDLMSFIQNFDKVTEEYNCGNDESLQTLVYKNITYEFNKKELDFLQSGDSGTSSDDIISSGSNMIANTRSVDHKCKFKRLKVLDQSTSNSKSRYFLSIQAELSTFPRLEFYNLSNTGQTEISKEFITWWRFFPKLKTLDLSHNYISTIDLDSSASLWDTYDVDLDLSYNNITELSQDDIKLIAGISNVFVDMHDNPFDCSCTENMLELVQLIADDTKWEALQLQRYDYLKTMACHTPYHLKGKLLKDVIKADLSCPALTASLSIAPIIILSVTIVILIVIIILLTKFRKEIFILTYTRFHIILPCQPADVSEHKTYDAFVSYSNHDEEWVSKTFKEFESASSDSFHQFRFCLHHRDFIPGKTIFDNVIDSVESSRHTVIILSRHFLQSHYCMYEFHEAFQQSIIERKRHMVVVLMENIPEEELPTDLKRCLKTFTYIRKDDSIFTDRLIYAMSHKPRRESKSNKNQIAGHDNVGFTSDKSVTPRMVSSRPQCGESIITLSQIVPDLVVAHNETKNSDTTA